MKPTARGATCLNPFGHRQTKIVLSYFQSESARYSPQARGWSVRTMQDVRRAREPTKSEPEVFVFTADKGKGVRMNWHYLSNNRPMLIIGVSDFKTCHIRQKPDNIIAVGHSKLKQLRLTVEELRTNLCEYRERELYIIRFYFHFHFFVPHSSYSASILALSITSISL